MSGVVGNYVNIQYREIARARKTRTHRQRATRERERDTQRDRERERERMSERGVRQTERLIQNPSQQAR